MQKEVDMKKKFYLSLVLVLAFAACDNGSTSSVPGFNGNADDLTDWLHKQPANTPATAYKVKLNVDSLDLVKTALQSNSDKYVYLDLSGSTFTSIEGAAFEYCKNLTGVIIPNSVTEIGGGAFEACSGLANITIPNSVTSIGEVAFSCCTGLTSVTIGSGVTTIGERAFDSCPGLTSVTIPNNVTSIEFMAFSYCTSLANVTIGSGVTSIGIGAFAACTSLAAINVASGNTEYSSANDVLYNKDKTTLIKYPGAKAGTFTIPDSVTNIGVNAFSGYGGLTSVTIGNSVTTIEGAAFAGCTGLTSVTIPDSVTTIEAYAFFDCSGLTGVTFEGTITSANFNSNDSFLGDLRNKFYATDAENGTPGTYTTTAPVNDSSEWTKQ
jgi:hypothetical protein